MAQKRIYFDCDNDNINDKEPSFPTENAEKQKTKVGL